jgi:hypothetical protein
LFVYAGDGYNHIVDKFFREPDKQVVIANEELRIEELNTAGQKYRTKKYQINP